MRAEREALQRSHPRVVPAVGIAIEIVAHILTVMSVRVAMVAIYVRCIIISVQLLLRKMAEILMGCD